MKRYHGGHTDTRGCDTRRVDSSVDSPSGRAENVDRVSLFIIIPVHNRLEFTRACLTSLRRQSVRDFIVVVVDDGSTDGTGDVLAEEFPEVRVLRGDGTLWWTGATNVGVRWTMRRASDAAAIVTLNNDTLPPPDYIGRLLAAKASRPSALVGSLLVRAADRTTIVDGGIRISWPIAKYTSDQEKQALPAVRNPHPVFYRVDVLSGCGTMIPIRLFKKVGIYDERRLRHYAADYELSRRALAAGFPLYVDKTSILYVHERESGLHSAVGDRDLRALARSFWGIGSATDLRLRWRFARRACPRRWQPTYIPCDYARVLMGSLRRHWTNRSYEDPRREGGDGVR